MDDNQDLYASSIVEQYTEEYAHENFKSFFPSAYDGCKCVYRRTIHAFQKAGIADGTTVKSTEAVANVNKTHPSGTTSMYEVITKMAQPWVTNPPMMESNSNMGSYGGNNPAAERYTQVKLSNYTKEMFLDDINITALPKVEGPFLDLEPAFYIPALPTALLIDNLTIGFAISCLTTRLNFSNVCDLVKDYVNHQIHNPYQPWDYKKLADKFVPDFPSPCVITNEKELIEAYKKGDFDHPIDMEGQVVITKNKITVEALPHGTPFKAAFNYFEKHLRDNPKGEVKNLLKDYNITRNKPLKGNFSIYPKQGVSTLYLWKLIEPIIRFQGRYHPNPNYTLDDQITVKKMTYVDILNVWYKKRVMILMATKRRKLERLQREKQIIEAKMILVQFPDKVIEIFRSAKNKKEIMEKLKEEFDFTPFESNALSELPLSTLTQTSMESLKEQQERVKNEIESLLGSFKRISEEIMEKADYFKKKYGSKGRISLLPDYKGYIEFEHGNVLFEDHTQVEEILDSFPDTPCKIHQFTKNTQIVIGPNGKETKSNLHKYMWNPIISIAGDSTSQGMTICIKDGCASWSPGIKVCPPQDGVFYTGMHITTLHRNGKITRGTVSLIGSKRVNCLVSQGAKTDIIHVLRGTTQRSFYVLSFNTSEPNVMRLERIDKDKERYISNPDGTPFIFTSLSGKEWYITPPKECVNRFKQRVIRIVDAEALLDGKTSVYIDLLSRNKRNSSLQYFS